MRHTKEKYIRKNIIAWLYSVQQPNAHPFDIKRYLIPAVIAYGCGICLILSSYRAAARELFIYLFTIFLIYTAALTILSLTYKLHKTTFPFFLRLKWIILPFALLITFALGMYRSSYMINIQHRALKDASGSTVWVCGTIETVPKLTASGYRTGFVLTPYHIENKNREVLQPVSGKIQVYLPSRFENTLHRGDAIEGYLELETPPGAKFSGGFDYTSYLNQNGIPVIAFGEYVSVLTEKPKRTLFQKYQDLGFLLNQNIGDSVSRHFSYNKESEAIVTGILIGDKTGFSDELYEDFSRAGIIHVTAVSGLHVSFLIAALSFVLTRFRLPKSVIHMLLIPFLLLFLSAALFTPSVSRAVIMTILFLLSYTIQKEPDQKTALFAAAGIMLTINPYLICNAGFILSFGSVLGIQLFNPLLEEKGRKYIHRLSEHIHIPIIQTIVLKTINYLSSSLGVSISSFLGTFYFSTYFFHIFPLSGIIAGLWIIPCAMLIFIGGYMIWLFDFITPWIGQILRCFLVLPIEIIKQTAALLSESSIIKTTASPSASMFFFYLTFLFLLHFYLKYSNQFNKKETAGHTQETNLPL